MEHASVIQDLLEISATLHVTLEEVIQQWDVMLTKIMELVSQVLLVKTPLAFANLNIKELDAKSKPHKTLGTVMLGDGIPLEQLLLALLLLVLLFFLVVLLTIITKEKEDLQLFQVPII